MTKMTTSHDDIVQATKDGAILRLRPKLMTVVVNLMGLIPIMGNRTARPC
jgi:Cu(I)/Ag(I) efflux system membrane protein CusA/SilA